MNKFQYSARDKTGNLVKGETEANSENEVALRLIRSGINPLSITPIIEKTLPFKKIMVRFRSSYPSLEDLVFFSRQMYSLTRAGVPLVRAIKVVEDSSKNEKLREALADTLVSMKAGRALASSMANHPKVFTELMTALVKVGENSGNLDKVFQQMASYFERESGTRKRISEVMRYPATVLVVIFIAFIVVNVLVLPVFANFFKEYGAKLPFATQILMGTSSFILQYWGILLAVSGAVIFFTIKYFKTKTGGYLLDRFKFKIPLIGNILKRSILARFSRCFALCSHSGVPPLQSITLVANALDNDFAEEKIIGMRTYIEHGETLVTAATLSGIFTPLVLQMLAVGEETGDIDRLLNEIADYYEQEVDYEIKRLGDAMEPILLILIGCVVLVLALGVYLPMWDISSVMFSKVG